MRLLLDTHAILWMIADDPRLGASQRKILQEADELLWSVVSLWEIGIKLSLERRDFRLGPGWARLIPEELSRNRIRQIPLQPAHCEEVSRLPWHHRDPFDRVLIAQARIEDCTLFSRDESIDDYDVRRIW